VLYFMGIDYIVYVMNMVSLTEKIHAESERLGFQALGITDTTLGAYGEYLKDWLKKGHHGDMAYLEKNLEKRLDPAKLIPGTKRLIVVRMNYFPPNDQAKTTLQDKHKGYISRYALGRDYHKLLRKRLQKLADFIQTQTSDFQYRVFVDTGPVMEKAFAEKAGIGWIGKNTLVLNQQAGSYFFLGTLLTNLTLPCNPTVMGNHCGKCIGCMKICPTQAIVAPGQLDATKCISYLTIEYRGSIPEHLRPLIGNRIYGCDDCQLICPWNRYAKITDEKGFHPRQVLLSPELIDLFALSEAAFTQLVEGSAMKRVSYVCWLRNIAVALGNAPSTPEVIQALQSRQQHESELVREHVAWALEQHIF